MGTYFTTPHFKMVLKCGNTIHSETAMELQAESERLGGKAHELIKEICDVAYTRLPGSEGEAKAQKFIGGKFKE